MESVTRDSSNNNIYTPAHTKTLLITTAIRTFISFALFALQNLQQALTILKNKRIFFSCTDGELHNNKISTTVIKKKNNFYGSLVQENKIKFRFSSYFMNLNRKI